MSNGDSDSDVDSDSYEADVEHSLEGTRAAMLQSLAHTLKLRSEEDPAFVFAALLATALLLSYMLLRALSFCWRMGRGGGHTRRLSTQEDPHTLLTAAPEAGGYRSRDPSADGRRPSGWTKLSESVEELGNALSLDQIARRMFPV